jgi:uncharacterized damage-inducible protein DinB
MSTPLDSSQTDSSQTGSSQNAPPRSSGRETMLFWRYITSSIDQLLATLEGLDAREINWSPIANANSLYVLATHTMGTTAENLLEVLCGQPVHRQREAEFAAYGETTEALHAQWQSLRVQIQAQLEQLDAAAPDAERQHPRRGKITGRDVLIVVARHCAEHMGQAFLTRDLILARRNTAE